MTVWVVVNEHAPGYIPNDRNGPEEIKHVGPTTRRVVYNEPACKIRQNYAELTACNGLRGRYQSNASTRIIEIFLLNISKIQIYGRRKFQKKNFTIKKSLKSLFCIIFDLSVITAL